MDEHFYTIVTVHSISDCIVQAVEALLGYVFLRVLGYPRLLLGSLATIGLALLDIFLLHSSYGWSF